MTISAKMSPDHPVTLSDSDGVAVKVIVVIGASRGIGRATALAFAAPGTHLVLAARDGAALEAVAAEARAAGADASAIPCDVTAEPHVRRLIETAAGITG